MTTPYDGKIGVWQWKGDSLVEETIQAVATTLKTWAPNVKQILVKTSDGSRWQGTYDTDRDLAIDGTDSIKRWVQALEANGLEFHAWCVPKGRDLVAETDLIIAACQQAGVRSMILDIEPYAGFWEGGKDQIRPYMTRIRQGVPSGFHIGISVDPRPQHYSSIYPDQWFPFIDSVHLMIYWETFQKDPEESVDEAFRTWRNFGRPLFPILQGNAKPAGMDLARVRSLEKQKATGVSWWRLGVINSAQWASINVPVSGKQPAPDEGRFGKSIVVTAQDPRFAFGTHTTQPPEQVFTAFQNSKGWKAYYRPTQTRRSQVWARWDPQLTESGWYEISAYVPNQHATTAGARLKVHSVEGRSGEVSVNVPQGRLSNIWTPLGVFRFNADNPTAGLVFLNDLTGEIGLEVAFDAMRWRQVLNVVPTTQYLADGYDAPFGTVEERLSTQMWPGKWFDATGYAVRYRIGTPYEAYHTGADINLNEPAWDADAHSPVYSAASGVVTHAGRLAGWGNVICIKHDPLLTSGKVMYGRYAHVENMRVQVGQRVSRGEQIASVGNAEGAFPYHLHFDLSPTSILQTEPWHWPKLDLNNLLLNYVDPRLFVQENRPPEP